MSAEQTLLAPTGSRRSGFVDDLMASLRLPDLWLRAGFRDVILTYSRAGLGPIWSFLTALAWIGVIYVFLGPNFSGQVDNYLSYVASGVVIYNFLSNIISGGVGCFIRLKGPLLNFNIPLFLGALRHVSACCLHVAIQLPLVLGALLIDGAGLSWSALLAVPAFALVVVCSVFVCAGFGALGVRIGDLTFFLQATMRVLFIATPVFWIADGAGTLRTLVSSLNPFAWLLDAIRSPILGQVNDPGAFAVAAAIAVGSAVVFGLIYAALRTSLRRYL